MGWSFLTFLLPYFLTCFLTFLLSYLLSYFLTLLFSHLLFIYLLYSFLLFLFYFILFLIIMPITSSLEIREHVILYPGFGTGVKAREKQAVRPGRRLDVAGFHCLEDGLSRKLLRSGALSGAWFPMQGGS